MSPLFATGFRPFFLLATAHAVLSMGVWLAMLTGALPAALSRPIVWHVHEMLFGFVPAVIAGFLLTAVPKWTASPAASGAGLKGLVALWLLGRVAGWFVVPGQFQGGQAVAAIVSASFLPVLAVVVAIPILKAGQGRNYSVPAVLLVLAACQGLFLHGGYMVRAETLALDLYMILLLIVGGRITPAFTRNWLNRQQRPAHDIVVLVGLERAFWVTIMAVVVGQQIGLGFLAQAILCLLAGPLLLARLWFWRGYRVLSDTLLSVLHIGHLWIAAALLLRAAGLLSMAIPHRAWMHALAIGAMGTLILGVMARVTLGHTGRELKMPPLAWTVFLAITAAAVLRTFSASGWIARSPALESSAVAWLLAFTLFAVFFSPMLVKARVDGRPG
jgi:uncharacterized protein involved in response to NO